MCCAAEMQLPSFYQSENPLFRSFGARGFLFAFLLACLCELHRIRIVQAEMGLAGSRTSFSFPPNRKPSFLSAIFCICHHVCPLVHPILPVTAFGWQFLYRGCIFVVTVFLLSNFSGFAALWDDTPHMTCGWQQGTAPPDNSVQNGNGTEIGEAHYGLVSCQLFEKVLTLVMAMTSATLRSFLQRTSPRKKSLRDCGVHEKGRAAFTAHRIATETP